MHVKENTALSSTGDVEIKEVVEESSSITNASSVSQTSSSTVSSSSPLSSSANQADNVSGSVSIAHSITDCIGSTRSVPEGVQLTLGVGGCVSVTSVVSDTADVSRRLAQSTVESDSLAQSITLTESVSSTQSVSESVCSTQSVANCVISTQSVAGIFRVGQNATHSSSGSIAPTGGHGGVSSLPLCDMSVDATNGSDSAMETDDDDSSEDEMVIDAKDIKQEVDSEAEDIKQEVDSECEDTVDGAVLHRLRDIDLKLEPDSDSNSSCSLTNNLAFWNRESDASMRQRLFNSLSQSFPDSALSRVLHSVDTMPLDSEDEDLVPSADRLSSSCFSSIRLDKEDDDDLTSLTWLQDSDLLKNINPDLNPISDEQKENADGQKNGESGGGNFVPQTHPHHVPYNPMKHINSKPPYSFSCLIFMAVEAAPGKKLPVKDIYNWILTNFPYFRNAPTGWKNSVRHNLSLNKCFKKVEKDKGANIGKGSLWCIDPEYRPNLLQALRKTPYHPYQQLQMMSSMVPQQQVHHIQGLPANAFRPMPLTQRPVPNTVSPHLFPFLSRRLAQTNVDRETHDVANVLLAMSSKNSSGRSSDGSDASGPTSPSSRMKRKICGPPKRQGPFILTPCPFADHNYSSPKILEEDAASGTSSIDNEYDFGDNDDDISEPSDYPSDWDETSGDEVDGDLPQQLPRKRPRMDLNDNNGEVKDEDQEGARLLMSFAGLATYSDEEEKRNPVKSSSSSCAKARASSSSATKPRQSSSASPSTTKRRPTTAAASKSSSSLSSSQSSASSSRSSTAKSTARPVSRSALKSRLSPKTTSAKSASPASAKSSVSASSKASASSSKTAGVSASKSSGGASPSSSSSSLKKSDLTTPPPSAKQAVSTPESAAKSSNTSTPSTVKSSIIMTRRGKIAAAEAAAEAARWAAAEAAKLAAETAKTTAAVATASGATGAVHRMRTRGKKLSFS